MFDYAEWVGEHAPAVAGGPALEGAGDVAALASGGIGRSALQDAWRALPAFRGQAQFLRRLLTLNWNAADGQGGECAGAESRRSGSHLTVAWFLEAQFPSRCL